MGKTVYTAGSFDLFHVGHLNVLERCREIAGEDGKVFVGVHTDESVESRKGRPPVIPLLQRIEIVKAVRYVDDAMAVSSVPEMVSQAERLGADVMVNGADVADTMRRYGVEIPPWAVFVPRTEGVSTTQIREKIEGKTESTAREG